jgi:hypothetical protein
VSDRGSIAPLGIGLAMLSLFTVLVTASAGTLFLTQKRLTTLAEATALALATDNQIVIEGSLLAQAEEFIAAVPESHLNKIQILNVSMQDALTFRVLLCVEWSNPLLSYSISDTGKVCSEGLARRGK